MQIATVFLWITIFAVFFLVLSHMMPFFRGRAYFTARESTLRIILVSFLTFVPFLLAAVFLSPLLKIGIRPFVEKILGLWITDRTMAIFAPATILFLALAGTSIPLAAIFHYLFGFELFLKANRKYELPPKAIEENPTVCELLNIFSHCLKSAGEERLWRIFLLGEGPETPPIFPGCGIIGKDKRLALLVSKDFVRAFQEGQLTKEEVEAIFFHEIAHIKNKDYFLPLWSKMFIQSRLFFIAWGSFILGMIASSAAFVKMEGLGAVLNWSLLSKVIILTFGFVLLKGVIYTLLGENLRGREYLADSSAIRYTSRDATTRAIKKSAMLFAGVGRFSWLPFVLGRKSAWHPDPVKRIKALDERLIGFSGKTQPIRDVIFGTLTVAVFLFGVALVLEFLTQKWRMAELIDIYGPLNLFLTLFYFLAIGGLAAEHLFMRKYSASRAWSQVHIRNFLIALILSVLGNLATRFPTQIHFLYQFRLHFFKAFSTSFVMATLFSIFFVVSFQKRKPPGDEEVPIEGSIK